ncbi:COBRA-like protein 10 [Zingiber officinale]|uniref:COBRA-like protein 10 n=1 Tax=Zingiber officinale TaxID=94328 RepID=UPI001C4C541E|nr:COBRA-like protein 10 [Zingiber officinale]
MPSRIPVLPAAALLLLCLAAGARAQDYDNNDEVTQPPPKAQDSCNGAFLTYNFISRTKEFPRVKNASAQSWAFKAQATVLNTMAQDLQAWSMFIGFQHDEILVSVGGAVITDGTDFPAHVGNGTTLSGYPQTDLLTSIETAGDMSQIQAVVDLTGTQFGVKPPGTPMPRTIKLENPGYKCPAPIKKMTQMYVCCVKDPKFKPNKTDSRHFLPRRYGDLTFAYDVLQAYESNYMAQVTIDSNSPLGRLDNWNLTWEWKRGEFIYTMRGAYTLRKDSSDCFYGQSGKYYQGLDFANVMNCETKPTIVDLPPERAKDNNIGNLPYCCKNGTLLPPTMDPSQSKAIFQLQVYKIPPDLNRTTLYPPTNWKINGVLNANYVCGPPFRVSPMEFPDSNGLMSLSEAIASWQVVCNATRPKKGATQCCVSYSAYYNDSVIPCDTCACGCNDNSKFRSCDPDGRALLLPPEALLIPAENRTAKAKAWAEIKHYKLPRRLPCLDNCDVSINWHIVSNYRKGWTARITLFNWEEYSFKDWFVAVQMDKAYRGYERAYSFNSTKLIGPGVINRTFFLQGLEGLNYLIGETDGKNPQVDPRVPGKQQSVISFTKKETPGIDIVKGDGFPTRVYFNGEECALPGRIPAASAARQRSVVSSRIVMLLAAVVALLLALD